MANLKQRFVERRAAKRARRSARRQRLAADRHQSRQGAREVERLAGPDSGMGGDGGTGGDGGMG
jgi:hypothetical protein